MTTEDKILELLMDMQKNIVILTQDVSGLKQDVSALKQDISTLKQDVSDLKLGQQAMELKLKVLEKNQYAMQDDLSFIVRKTMENNDDIRKLKIS